MGQYKEPKSKTITKITQIDRAKEFKIKEATAPKRSYDIKQLLSEQEYTDLLNGKKVDIITKVEEIQSANVKITKQEANIIKAVLHKDMGTELTFRDIKEIKVNFEKYVKEHKSNKKIEDLMKKLGISI